jgi:hypothetical protein
MTNEIKQRNLARFTGVLYLLVILCAGFSQGYVRGTLFVSGDATATLNNILTSESLFRVGLVTDLIAFLLDAVISVLLYMLLKPAGKTLSMISSAFRLLAHPAIASLNLLNHFLALEVAQSTGPLAMLGVQQQEAWTSLFMTAHNYGYLIAGAFFGVHCLLLGVLLCRSVHFPSVFGLLMMAAAAGYLLESFGDFLVPGNEKLLANVVGISAAIGEVSLTLYLLIKGTRRANRNGAFGNTPDR